MADSIYTFDPTANNNSTLDGIGYAEGQLTHGNIDNMFRAVGAKLAQFVDDLGGVNTVGGSANAVTVTLASGITAYASGLVFAFKAGSANTGAATMNVNAIGAKAIRRKGDTALSAGDIAANGVYLVRYDEAYNTAAGAFVLLNPEGAGTSFASAIVPSSSDGAAIGSASLQWSDLFLASGGVINWANGNVTLTHSSGLLTSSSPLSLGTSNALTAGTIELGHASDTTISRGAAGFIAVEGKRVPSPASQAAGDILYRGSTEWERLAKGTASQVLQMNSGATAPEWVTLSTAGLGVGQTWQNVTGSRAEGTSYQNTTGAPIAVGLSLAITANDTSDPMFQVSTDNSTWVDLFRGYNNGHQMAFSAVVPNNYYYRVPSNTDYSIAYWSELR